MPAIDSWLAGVFDASGVIYEREGGGLAVRVYFPKRSMANQVRMTLGGKVGGLRPAYWTIGEQGDIDRFSVDRLIIMLAKAGMRVKVEVLPAAA